MSWQASEEPDCAGGEDTPVIDLVITPKEHDIGGLVVRRTLPNRNRRSVGPFVFLDQMGPAVYAPGEGLDVRPHPHIGLATITYLFEGAITHRDSLGVVAVIRPGEVNWMTAGHGITHSERTPPEERAAGHELFGIQAWVALPVAHEETEPSFVHHGAEDLPVWSADGLEMRLIIGTLGGKSSPVQTFAETFYADARLAADAAVTLPAEHAERATHVAAGTVEIEGCTFHAGQTVVFHPGRDIVIRAATAARVMLLGGAPLDGPRRMWWNFVSHSAERLEQAKADWKAGRFPAVPGETEFIPLPE